MRRAAVTPCTRYAQAATEYAKSCGKADAFHRAAYRAYWAEGANLGDFDVLRDLAVSVGLDWADLEPRLRTGELDAILETQHDEALQTGIHGIPGFVIDDKFWFTGAQPIEVFRLAVKRAIQARNPQQGAAGFVIGEG